ncbi:MAG: CynX/NimT family MFS transporter [Anaerovoracaceae bacterium]
MKKDLNKKKIFAAVLIVVTAVNLRAPITCVGSLINMISDDFGLSAGYAGFITTIPLLAFAAVSPAAVFISEKLGAGRIMTFSFIILNVGILMRSYGAEVGIFAGTVVMGSAIAIGNVLLPAVIKSYFPERIADMTSLYTVIMQVISAFSTAVSVPLAVSFGWESSLSIWIISASLTVAVCFFNWNLKISNDRAGQENNITREKSSIYRKPMTWWITFYMGIQSLIFYSFIAWLSPMLQDRGYGQDMAGYVLSAFVIMGVAGSAALPFIMKRNKSQKMTGIQLGLMYFAGILAVIFAKGEFIMIAGIMLSGFCSGTCISFSMSLFGLHTSNGEDASRLSGTAQSAGYLLAAAGPVALGKLYESTGQWPVCFFVLLLCAAFLTAAGRIVGREEIL